MNATARQRRVFPGIVAMVLGLGAAAYADDRMVPFVIPARPDPTSLAAYLPGEAIAAKGPRVVARDGHFYLGASRVRFWSVNLTFGDCFPTHEDAQQLALRLSQAGVNCVRLHHMDMFTWSQGRGIWDNNDPRKLSAEALDRLDDLLDQLAQHGIYADLNLHVSRTHSKFVGLPEAPGLSYDKMIDIFTPQLIAAQQDYARRLLGHVNKIRGVRYADDPAIAIVEINNEDSLFMWGARHNLENLPEYYAGVLRGQFATWLKARYGSADKTREAWSKGSLPLGANMIVDGQFKDLQNSGQANWPLEVHAGNTARVVPAADQAGARVEITQADQTSWHVQFQQQKLSLRAGQYYTVAFKARADEPRTISYGVSQQHDPWGGLGLEGSAKLTREWQSYRSGFVATKIDDQVRLSFLVGGTKGAIEFADITLCPGGQEGLRNSENLEAGNVALFGGGQTAARTQDTWRFLAETEKHFWDTMYASVKRDLSCKAMVTGTIVFGPLGMYGQSDMDFVDAHAYWHHPNFPGRPWDSENWTVDQKAMVDSPAEATLFRLACSRLYGKPFTVTEYNEPAPNDYQAECVPELASFAAAQDWDGVWFFDHGHAPDHFSGFFDICSNPAKWGFMSAGAAIFRDGALGPLPRSRPVSLSRDDDVWGRLPVLQEKHDLNMLAAMTDAQELDWDAVLHNRVYAYLKPAALPEKPHSVADAASIRWEAKGVGGYEASGPGAWVWIGRSGAGVAGSNVLKLNKPGFAAIMLSCMDGQPFVTTKKVLVAACGRCENTGMEFRADRRSVGRQWGHGPVTIEAVDATIRLPALAAGRWMIQTLAPDGRPAGESQPLQIGADAQLHLDAGDKTMWHLLTRQ
jgi:hypothetical protein